MSNPPLDDCPRPGRYEWVRTTPTQASYLSGRALSGGHEGCDGSPLWIIRAWYNEDLIPGKLSVRNRTASVPYSTKEITVQDIEVLCADPESVRWVPAADGNVPRGAIEAGRKKSTVRLYIGRVEYQQSLVPGKVDPENRCCYITFYGQEVILKRYDVLCTSRRSDSPPLYNPPLYNPSPRSYEWVRTTSTQASSLSGRALSGGHEGSGDSPLWIIRAWYDDDLTPGKLAVRRNAASVPYNGKEIAVQDIEVLCANPESIRWVSAADGNVPQGAIEAGHKKNSIHLYIGRVDYQQSLIPGKVDPENRCCSITFHGQVVTLKRYDVLCTSRRSDSPPLYNPPIYNPPPRSFEWVSTTSTQASSLSGRALSGGHEDSDDSPLWIIRAWYHGDLTPGKLAIRRNAASVPYNGKEIAVQNIEVLCANPESIRWVSAADGNVPQGAIEAGHKKSSESFYIGRVEYQQSLIPGKVDPENRCCSITFHGQEVTLKRYDVLCTSRRSDSPPQYNPPLYNPPQRSYEWVRTTSTQASSLSGRALSGGHEGYDDSPLWIIRAWQDGDLTPGKLAVKRNAAYVPYNGHEIAVQDIEVLCANPESVRWVSSGNGEVPQGAIEAGHKKSSVRLYIGRIEYQQSLTPGKVDPENKCLYITSSGEELKFYNNYDVLCTYSN